MPPDATDRVLRLLVIYRRPLDYPDHYVVRAQWVCRDGRVEPEPHAWLYPIKGDGEAALEAARADCRSKGLTRLGREVDDDPVIVESWI